jgi:hypothetical protein
LQEFHAVRTADGDHAAVWAETELAGAHQSKIWGGMAGLASSSGIRSDGWIVV